MQEGEDSESAVRQTSLFVESELEAVILAIWDSMASDKNITVHPVGANPSRYRLFLRSLFLFAKLSYVELFEWHGWARQTRATSIKPPPGSRLLKLTDFFCSPKTMKLTVNPLIADWRKEYFDALKEGRGWKARWISARYYCAFGKALVLDKVLGMLKAVSSVFSGG